MPAVDITSDWTPPVDGTRGFSPSRAPRDLPNFASSPRPVPGTEDLTRIHFETRDSMERGMPTAAPNSVLHRYESGLLNRLAASVD
jgi:hypothetical protein